MYIPTKLHLITVHNSVASTVSAAKTFILRGPSLLQLPNPRFVWEGLQLNVRLLSVTTRSLVAKQKWWGYNRKDPFKILPLASNVEATINNTHNWNRVLRVQVRNKTGMLIWIWHMESVYVHASMKHVERSYPDSDTAMTTGWSANENLEFDPRPIDTGEQSPTSSHKTVNTQVSVRSPLHPDTPIHS